MLPTRIFGIAPGTILNKSDSIESTGDLKVMQVIDRIYEIENSSVRIMRIEALVEIFMVESITRLRDLCDMLLSMGFAESVNEAEIKRLIANLETIIIEEMKILKERESMSDT